MHWTWDGCTVYTTHNKAVRCTVAGGRTVKYLRRFLWFITSRLFWITVLSGVLIVTFYLAMNVTNIYILLQDGLDARAGVVLVQKDPSELNKFFVRKFLEQDRLLQVGMSDKSVYAAYDIRGYEHSTKIESIWAWPWDSVGSAVITEDVPKIDGKVKSSQHDAMVAARGEEAVNPPKWQAARYKVTLVRDQGQWKISSMEMTEVLSN